MANVLNLGDVINTASGSAGGLISGAIQANQSRLAYERNIDLMNRAAVINEDAAKAAYERELEADSSKHQREVADLKAAGINPMLAAGASGGSVSSSPSSVSNPGMSPSHMPGVNLGSIIEAQRLKIERDMAQADIDLKEAQKRKLDEETISQEIRNWIDNETKEAQKRSIELEAEMKEGKIRLTDAEINKAREEVKLLIEQQKSEQSKQGLMLAQKVLAEADAYQIAALIPYQQKLLEAQTENQKAAAALAWAHEAYQRGLIDNGYLDAFCREAVASASTSESEAAVAGVKAAIQSGDYTHSAMSYVPVISEAVTGMANAFGIIGNIFGSSLRLK